MIKRHAYQDITDCTAQDDLGVIAEVIACQSFEDKFEADDTQT